MKGTHTPATEDTDTDVRTYKKLEFWLMVIKKEMNMKEKMTPYLRKGRHRPMGHTKWKGTGRYPP